MLTEAPTSPQEKRRQLTHHKIVTAGSRLFTVHGVSQVTVEDILLEAGVSRGTFYKYFSNREDVLRAVVSPVLDFLINRFANLDQVDSEEVLEEVLRSYFQQWQNGSEAFVLAFNMGQANFNLIAKAHEEYVFLLAGLIKRIHGQGILRLDDQIAASLLIARTVVPMLQSLQKTTDFELNFISAMKGMLLKKS